MDHGRYDLTEFEWNVIKPLLPNKARGVPRVDDRRVLNGIFLSAKVRFAFLPERYGPYTTVYNRFNRWRKAGVWNRLMDAIIAAYEAKGQKLQMIDSTSVRFHQQAAAQKNRMEFVVLGRSRGGLTTKMHLRVNEHGLPCRSNSPPVKPMMPRWPNCSCKICPGERAFSPTEAMTPTGSGR